MMKFLAEIDIMPHKELLDPQGKTVANNMSHINLKGVEKVRIGKHIQMTLVAESETDAHGKVEIACQKILSNPIMEGYSFTIQSID